MRKNGNKKKHRKLKIFFLSFSTIVLLLIISGAIYVRSLMGQYRLDIDKILEAKRSLIIYDKSDNEVSLLYSGENRINISIDEVPDITKKAFISAEDARFYSHKGVDWYRVMGAIVNDIKAGGYVQGASTITQQLIKLSHLTSEKKISRKIEEAILASELEKKYSKDEILEMYLNYVYFGGGYYGIEAASRGYFGVHASELTLDQSATLAAILKSPTNYAPHIAYENCMKRRNTIIKLMCDYGYISESEKELYSNKKTSVLEQKKEQKRGYYIDFALENACEKLDITMDELLTGGYRIYTAMDTEIQESCEKAFSDNENFPDENCQGAIVIVESNTSYVCAMVGGRNNENAMAFNRVTDIRRQPGSVIKPIIAYAPALENNGFTAATAILDEKTDFNGYSPSNFADKYYGWVTMREAVKKSLNVPAVKVFSQVGVDNGKAFAQKVGIEFDESDNSLALVLGGFKYGVSPYQIAGAYCAFASGGIYSTPNVIRYITDENDKILYKSEQERTRVMSEENAYILTSMLSSAISEGTGKRLGELGIDLAGKTGTVGENDDKNGNRDAWMAAYNSEYVSVVWLGFDSSKEGQSMPYDATGGMYPAKILKSIYADIYESREAPKFTIPSGVKTCKLDLHTLEYEHEAVLANALTPQDSVISEYFVQGTEPKNTSNYWSVPMPPDDLYCSVDNMGNVKISFTASIKYANYRVYREDEFFNTILINEFSGGSGSVSFSDDTVEGGMMYCYYVIPYHKELSIGNNVVSGIESRRIYVNVPDTNIPNDDYLDGN